MVYEVLATRRVWALACAAAVTAGSVVAIGAVASSANAAAFAAGSYAPLTPTRLLDTRSGIGAPVAAVGANKSISIQVEGKGEIPATNVSAVVLNVTVVGPTSTGYITVYPDGTTRPSSSNVNFHKGQTIPNSAVSPPARPRSS